MLNDVQVLCEQIRYVENVLIGRARMKLLHVHLADYANDLESWLNLTHRLQMKSPAQPAPTFPWLASSEKHLLDSHMDLRSSSTHFKEKLDRIEAMIENRITNNFHSTRSQVGIGLRQCC